MFKLTSLNKHQGYYKLNWKKKGKNNIYFFSY